MAERKTYDQRREYILAYGLGPGVRATWREGAYRIAVTVQAVTHRMMVVVRLDEPAFGRSAGSEKRMEPFALRPGHPSIARTSDDDPRMQDLNDDSPQDEGDV